MDNGIYPPWLRTLNEKIPAAKEKQAKTAPQPPSNTVCASETLFPQWRQRSRGSSYRKQVISGLSNERDRGLEAAKQRKARNDEISAEFQSARNSDPALWKRKVEAALLIGPRRFGFVSAEAIASGALAKNDIDAIYQERSKFMPKEDVDKKVMINSPGGVCTQGGHDPYK